MGFLFRKNGGTGRTDGQPDRRTDGQGAALNAAPRMVAVSITFQYRVNERYTGYAKDEQTDRHISQQQAKLSLG